MVLNGSRHGRRGPDGRAWSKRYLAWLTVQRWPLAALQQTFTSYRRAIDDIVTRLRAVDTDLQAVLAAPAVMSTTSSFEADTPDVDHRESHDRPSRWHGRRHRVAWRVEARQPRAVFRGRPPSRPFSAEARAFR